MSLSTDKIRCVSNEKQTVNINVWFALKLNSMSKLVRWLDGQCSSTPSYKVQPTYPEYIYMLSCWPMSCQLLRETYTNQPQPDKTLADEEDGFYNGQSSIEITRSWYSPESTQKFHPKNLEMGTKWSAPPPNTLCIKL